LASNYEGNTFVFSIVTYLDDGVLSLSVLEADRRMKTKINQQNAQ